MNIFALWGEIEINRQKAETDIKAVEKQADTSGKRMESSFEKVTKAIGTAVKRVDDFGKKATKLGTDLSKTLTAPIVGVTAALAALTAKSSDTAGQIEDLSRKMGISTDAFQEMNYWATQNGLSQAELERAVGRLNQRIGLAANGNEGYARALERLGVSMADVKNGTITTEQAMATTIRTLSQMTNEQEKSAVAADLFGTMLARNLMPALSDGALSMEDAARKAHELGLVLDAEAIAKASEFGDRLDDMKAGLSAATTEIGMSLAPTFEALVRVVIDKVVPAIRSFGDWLNRLINWFGNLSGGAQKTILAITAFAVAVGPAIALVGKLSTGVGVLLSAFGSLVTFISTKLIPAILGLNLKMVVITAAIAAVAAGAYVIIRAWEDAKNALSAIWDGIKAGVERLDLGITLAMAKLDLAIYQFVQSVLSNFSALEKIPIIGNLFSGATSSIANNVEQTTNKIAALERALEDNAAKSEDALERRRDAIAGIGDQIKEDVAAIMSFFSLDPVEAAEVEREITDIFTNLYELEYEYTDVVAGESEDRADERAFFEQLWNDRLFDLTAERLEKLEAEYKEAVAIAEELGADKTAIEEWYAISRTQIIEEEEQRKTEIARKEQEKRNEEARRALERIEQIEGDYRRKLFEQSADYIDVLQREKQEQIAIALEAGADWLLIDKYYNNLIAQERQKRADELARIAQDEAEELARIKKAEADAELAEQKRLEDERNRFVADYHRRLFEQSADRIDILQREKQEQIAIAQELGADWFVVDTYYNSLIAKERQKRADEILKIAEQEAEAERLIQERKAEEIARIEADWHKKLFEQSADRIDILQREKQEQIQIAMDAGADWLAIDEYYNNEIIKERERRAAELARVADKEAEDALAAQEKIQQARLSFEQSWADKAASLDTSPEARLAQLEVERGRILEQAEELYKGVEGSHLAIEAIDTYYAKRRGQIEEEIAEGQKSWWEKKMDELDPPLERLKSVVWDAGKTLFEFGKAIASGNWLDAFLAILMETESFAKAMELLGAVLDPVIALFDAVLAPIINFLLKLWNGIIDALSKISIFGWKPFGGLADKKIGLVGEDSASGGGGGKGTGGRQVSEITGPTRDLLTDLMAPLANFGQIVAPIQDIRNILYERLPNYDAFGMDFAGAGAIGPAVVIENLYVTAPTTGVDDISRATIDQIEKALAGRINLGIRGRGGR